MRKYKKVELCDCIYTLKEATRKMNLSDVETRAEILPQCQEMAIAVGTTIEQLEGEGTKAVSYLEEYCEELYLASSAQDQTSWKAISKKMDKLLNSIQNSIRYDLPDSPSEIVFIPYKASMWDALDSVYRAAIQEENCHVIVMPIPYYNINRKDQRMDMHYEGDLFPADIPVTDYKMYDLAKERPDVIFIHNPYDAQNYVTQVPEEYFSSKLIEYTDHLVYIPYFVSRGDKVKDLYCAMPAVQNAWRTFVQSKDVRKCYLQNGADPEKIVAMGSPKFDMVIRMQENPPELPETWKEALSDRKVFLLNTHLNPIINEAEKMIDKLHQIFELFRKREDAALLWRPHPLSIETAKAMNPKILGSYLQLVEEFKTLPNGVYDESPDVHRAIAISDAYVGDWSSLVTLYGITGKPIYTLSINCDTNIYCKEEAYRLRFACGAIVNGVLWAPAENHNGLYQVDLKKNKARLVCRFTEENASKTDELYKEVICYNNKLFLVPWRAKSIAIYDLKSGDMEYITPKYDAIYGLPKFSKAIQFEDHLYLFPAKTPAIVCLNLTTMNMEYFTECCKKLTEIGNIHATFTSGIIESENAWMGSGKCNCLVEFSMRDRRYKNHFIGSKDSTLPDVTVTDDGNKLYVLNNHNEVFEWDKVQGTIKSIWQYTDGANLMKFARIIWLKNCLWIIPVRESKVIKLDLTDANNCKIKELPIPDYCYADEDENMRRMINYVLQDNNIIVFPSYMNFAYIIKCDEDIVDEMGITLEDANEYDAKLDWITSNNAQENVFNEFLFPLEYFVDKRISNEITVSEKTENEFKKLQSNIDGSCGEKIWKYVEDVL